MRDEENGKSSGMRIFESGRGLIVNNEVYGNAMSGIVIETGGSPTIHNNRIHDGKSDGIYIRGNGQGQFDVNRIYRNADPGVYISEKGAGTFTRNVLSENKKGKLVYLFRQQTSRNTSGQPGEIGESLLPLRIEPTLTR